MFSNKNLCLVLVVFLTKLMLSSRKLVLVVLDEQSSFLISRIRVGQSKLVELHQMSRIQKQIIIKSLILNEVKLLVNQVAFG
ncbi:hypothetical protein MtrunA17_Chr5g0411891 [Medicago truncatula]|uniref:Transmembrane protein n=1 Tax=Medicago truncatula TaxID=3880 RepID=A0A396HNF1_MEDTR|nr:hypothetical protein MtrunA17_Chr5g0411891 [Medicago truncatula]